MSQVSMIFGIAPAIAPIIGGWILGWQPLADDLLVPGRRFRVLLWLADVARVAGNASAEPRACRWRRGACCATTWRSSLNPRFQRLAAAGTFNFGALFLYIASAPAFVLDICCSSNAAPASAGSSCR